jgi:hypothetical protein
LPKGKVIYRHFYFDIPEEIERKVTWIFIIMKEWWLWLGKIVT